MKKRKKWKNAKERYEYYYWMNKIFGELNAHRKKIFVVRIARKKWRGRLVGFYDPCTDKIYIDAQGELIPTLIHEALHAYFTPWEVQREESAVRELERAIVRGKITAGHMVRLYKYLLTKNGLLAKKFPFVH